MVVVVVMIRAGSFGSAARWDWENLSEAKLADASSLHISLVHFTICMTRKVDVRVEGIGILLEETPMSLQLKTDEQGTE